MSNRRMLRYSQGVSAKVSILLTPFEHTKKAEVCSDGVNLFRGI